MSVKDSASRRFEPNIPLSFPEADLGPTSAPEMSFSGLSKILELPILIIVLVASTLKTLTGTFGIYVFNGNFALPLASVLAASTHTGVTVFTHWSVICGGRGPGVPTKKLAAGVQKTGDKKIDPPRKAKISPFIGLGKDRRTPPASSRPLDHGST